MEIIQQEVDDQWPEQAEKVATADDKMDTEQTTDEVIVYQV